MAGIIASSATKVMLSGDTAADKVVTGYIVSESIALSTHPTGTAWSWGIAKPSGATVRSNLSATDTAAPSFVPDEEGYWVVTVTVDGTTTYVIRIAVLAVSQATITQAMRCSPVAEATVPAPPVGEALFFSEEKGRWCVKDSSDAVRDLDPGARTGTFTLSTGTATITDSSVTANTIVVPNCTTASTRGTLTYAVTPGTKIDITSSEGADASDYSYVLIA